MTMISSEPLRSRAYHEDLKWRTIYEKKNAWSYQQIAVNLRVDSSTVWRAVKQFDKGTVTAKKNKGSCLIVKSAILQALVERPSGGL